MKYKVNIPILFFGTSNFAVPALEQLVSSGYNVVGAVTKPDEPAGRGEVMTSPPVKIAASKNGLPVFQPENLERAQELPDADLYIVAAYGKIIPSSVLERARLGALNIHPSLLPHWRGPSPIQFTILQDDEETGVTIIKLDEFMDHGPIVAKRQLGISNFQTPISKLAYPELHDALAVLGADLMIEMLPKWIAEEITPLPQDDVKATFSRILKKDDGRIDWKKPADYIERMTRAFTPWPGAWTMWPDGNKIYRVRIEEAEIITNEESALGSEGYVWQSRDYPLLVKTGRGSLIVKRLTLEGKKSTGAEEFIRGNKEIVGSRLI